MHLTNLPLIGTSLLFLMPFYAAVDTQNDLSVLTWGALTCTSTFVHITKRPFHIHGPGNVIPWLYALDVSALYAVAFRCMVDGWHGGPLGVAMTGLVIGCAVVFFHTQHQFVHDPRADVSILYHATTHALTALGGVGLMYLRAFKNGRLDC